MTIRRVLVGTDESEEAASAARWGAAVARRCGGNVDFVEVVAGSAERTHERADELKSTAATRISGWLETHIGEHDPSVSVVGGDVVSGLADRASHGHADLVVIGSRAVEGVTNLALGSLVHELAHRLECPVVAVPASPVADDFGCIVVGVDGSAASLVGLRWAEALARSLGSTVCAVYGVDDIYETFTPSGPLGKDEHDPRAEVRHEQARSGIEIEFVERTASHPADSVAGGRRRAPPLP